MPLKLTPAFLQFIGIGIKSFTPVLNKYVLMKRLRILILRKEKKRVITTAVIIQQFLPEILVAYLPRQRLRFDLLS